MENSYCNQLVTEIDLYLENLHRFQDYALILEAKYTDVLKKLEEDIADLAKDEDAELSEIAAKAQKLYEAALDEFKSSEEASKYQYYQRRADVCNRSEYALIYYKNLLQVVSLMPNRIYPVELPTYFSSYCQKKFEWLSEYKNQRELLSDADKLTKKWDECFSAFEFPPELAHVSDDALNEVLAVPGFRPKGTEIDEDDSLLSSLAKTYGIPDGKPNEPEEPEIDDEMLIPAVRIAMESGGRVSTALFQRKFVIGFGRAARLIDEMEARGIISGQNGQKPREMLFTREECEAWLKKHEAGNDNPRVDALSVEKRTELKRKISEIEKAKARFIHNIFWGDIIRESFLVQLKKLVTEHPDFDLPEIAVTLRADELEEHLSLARELFDFRDLYRQTYEQVLITSQNYYFKNLLNKADRIEDYVIEIESLLEDIKGIFKRD